MAFVDEDEAVVGQVFKQRRRWLTRFAAREIARIVFDAGAGAGGHHHLNVEHGALFKALGLENAACWR